MANFARITVYPNRFESWPPCPSVVAGFEPLLIGIIWDNDPGTWESVTVQSFVDEYGAPVPTMGPNPTFHRNEGNIVKSVQFQLVTADRYGKYELVYKKLGSGETYVVDPTMMLRKL
jgi:hypothetical protein